MISKIPLIIYGIGLLIIVISLFKPKLGLYYIVPLLPFRNLFDKFNDLPLGKDINDLLFVSIIIGCFIHGREGKSTVSKKNPINRYMSFLILYSFISILVGYFYWGYSLSLSNKVILDFKNYIMLPVLFFMTTNLIKTKKEIYIMVLIMIFALFLADFHYYINIKYRTLDFYRQDLRTGGFMTNLGPNEVAAFYTHFLFLPLALMYYEKNKILKACYLGIVVFTLFPILFLFSRGAYIAALIGLIFLGMRKSKLILALMIIGAISWAVILPQAVVERINMTETEDGKLDNASSSRLEYWVLGLDQFKRSPLVGVGYNGSSYFRGGDLHNKYIEILAEEGIIGMWIFLALLINAWKNGVRLHRNAHDDFLKGLGFAASMVVISCSITNIFGDRWAYMEVSAFFFVLVALVVNAINLIENETMKLSRDVKHI